MTENPEYQPYGADWKKEMMKITIEDIQKITGLKKKNPETKDQYLERVAEKLKKEYYT